MIPASTRQDLERVLDHYALGQLRTAQRVEKGFVNDNWALTTDLGRFFLKRRHPDLRHPHVIRAQHNLAQMLKRAGFPVPMVFPTPSGQTLLIIEGEFYEIQEYVEGEALQPDRPTHLAEAARVLADYHAQVQGYSAPVLRDLGKIYTPALLQCVMIQLADAWRSDDNPAMQSLWQRLHAHIAELSERFAEHGVLPHLIIHGDYYADNLLCEGDRIVGVVDLDKSRWQARLVELAEALIYFASPRPGHLKVLVYPGFLQWDLFLQFLNNYTRTVNLCENEVRALPDYVRCIWMQMSLARLLEKGARPPRSREALLEVLSLADWAREHAAYMVKIARSMASR